MCHLPFSRAGSESGVICLQRGWDLDARTVSGVFMSYILVHQAVVSAMVAMFLFLMSVGGLLVPSRMGGRALFVCLMILSMTHRVHGPSCAIETAQLNHTSSYNVL